MMTRVLRYDRPLIVADGSSPDPITTPAKSIRSAEKIVAYGEYDGPAGNSFTIDFYSRTRSGGPGHFVGTVTVSDADRSNSIVLENVGREIFATITRTVGVDDFVGRVGATIVAR